MIHAKGAIHEMEFPDFFGCADVVLFTVAVGLVSAMIRFFLFKNLFDDLKKIYTAILLKIIT
jgi:hypothetical protein